MIDIEAIEARAKKATKGPWRWIKSCGYVMAPDEHTEVQIGKIGDFFDKEIAPFNKDRWSADADFIAHARDDIPALIAEVRRLRAEAEWLPIETAPKDGTYVLTCGPYKDRHYIEVCHFYYGKWTIVHMHDHGEPTHWMPLPALPITAPEGEK